MTLPSTTRPTASQLREAMKSADYDDPSVPPADAVFLTIDHGMGVRAEELRRTEDRKWHEDEALADAANSVLRMIRRNGRQIFSRHDARMLREMHERLRSVQSVETSSGDDPAFAEAVK